jgi:hypothetical protein
MKVEALPILRVGDLIEIPKYNTTKSGCMQIQREIDIIHFAPLNVKKPLKLSLVSQIMRRKYNTRKYSRYRNAFLENIEHHC